jgi:hypothetical protein
VRRGLGDLVEVAVICDQRLVGFWEERWGGTAVCQSKVMSVVPSCAGNAECAGGFYCGEAGTARVAARLIQCRPATITPSVVGSATPAGRLGSYTGRGSMRRRWRRPGRRGGQLPDDLPLMPAVTAAISIPICLRDPASLSHLKAVARSASGSPKSETGQRSLQLILRSL